MRAYVQGFINWITPDEMSVRDASGCVERGERPFRAIPLALFRPCRLAFHPSSLYSSLPSPFPSSVISLLSRRQDTGTDGRGNHDPLCSSRGLRRGRFQPRIPLTFRIRRIKHFGREIKRDPRRLVNTREQISSLSTFMITQTRVIKFRGVSFFYGASFIYSRYMYICTFNSTLFNILK